MPHSKRRLNLSLLPLLLFSLLSSLNCRRADAVPEAKSEREAQELLVRYLRINTTNPPGNETEAARFFEAFFAREGIASQLVGSDPRRQSIYARLASGSPEPALVLLHHLDVVPANDAEWSVAPFAGSQTDGYIWGRGALDIKSLGVAQLMAFVELRRRGAKLSRDVIFLGVADEEAGGLKGCEELIRTRPELFENVGFVLNEGGANETIVDRISFWGIEVDQKIPLWLQFTVRGVSGHGAVPPDDGGSAWRLIQAISLLESIPRPYRLVPSVRKSFSVLAARKPGRKGEILRDPERFFETEEIERELPPSYRALLRNTMAVSLLRAGSTVNSLPSEATAEIDIRLLPDEDPQAMLEKIRALVGTRAEISVLLQGQAAGSSPSDTPLYRLIEKTMQASEPSSVVGTLVAAGASDSRFFRAKGIVAYGISPFKVNYYDADSVHGVDEKIRTRFFDEGVRLMRTIVRDFCARR